MKLFIIIFLSFFLIQPVYSQNSLQYGDSCFTKGNYTCAEEKYGEAKKLATGRDKQIIEIKLSKAKWCLENLNSANREYFVTKNYKEAKKGYESVLESNPDDKYAKDQLERCNTYIIPPATTLVVSKDYLNFTSSGGTERISVTTNANSYTVTLLPNWCTVQKYSDYFVVNCISTTSDRLRTDYFVVTAGDKTFRVNISQSGNESLKSSLSVSEQNITFTPDGGSRVIDITTNSKDYRISMLPRWCKIELKTAQWFTLVCSKNINSEYRSDWFKINADGEEVIVYVTQMGNTTAQTLKESAPHKKGGVKKYGSIMDASIVRNLKIPGE